MRFRSRTARASADERKEENVPPRRKGNKRGWRGNFDRDLWKLKLWILCFQTFTRMHNQMDTTLVLIYVWAHFYKRSGKFTMFSMFLHLQFFIAQTKIYWKKYIYSRLWGAKAKSSFKVLLIPKFPGITSKLPTNKREWRKIFWLGKGLRLCSNDNAGFQKNLVWQKRWQSRKKKISLFVYSAFSRQFGAIIP